MLFSGKTSYRIVKSDSFDDATILLPDTLVDETGDTLSTRGTATNTTADKHEVDDITTFIERKFNDLSPIMEKRVHKLEDQITGLQNLNLLGNVATNKPITSNSDLYRDLPKNSIIELENQLSERNDIINFLAMQLIPKSQDKTKCSCSHNSNHKTKINKDKDNDTQLEKEDSSNEVVIIGDFMLNNINNCGLLKTKKADVLNFPGTTSRDILIKINELIIIHVRANDLTNDVNLLSNVKNECKQNQLDLP